MTKTAKPATIVVRPAKFEDVANIFRLARKSVDDRGKEATSDAILHHIVDLISGQGYIAVADLSGRIVGAAASQGAEVQTLGVFLIQHGFEDAGIEGALLSHIMKRSRDLGHQLLASADEDQPLLAKTLEDLGMKLVSKVYTTIQTPSAQK